MHRFVPLLSLLVCAWLAGCNGTPETLTDTAPPIQLDKLEFGSWKKVAPVARYKRADIALAIAESADHCAPYDIEELQVLRITRDAGPVELLLFRCRTSEEAYALYSVRRAESGIGHAVEVGASGTSSKDTVHAWKGRYYLTASSDDLAPAGEKQLLTAARFIMEKVTGVNRRPKLVRALPVDSLLPGSDLVFRCSENLELVWEFPKQRNVLRLDEGTPEDPIAKGVYAQYLFNTNEANLFVLFYRDSATASKVATAFMDGIYRPDATTYRDTGTVKEAQQEDGKWAIAFREGQLVVLVPPTDGQAEAKQTIREYLANVTELLNEKGS